MNMLEKLGLLVFILGVAMLFHAQSVLALAFASVLVLAGVPLFIAWKE